jgi:hypothetical protein
MVLKNTLLKRIADSRERTLKICGATIAGKYERQMSGGRSRANSVKN